jgi:lipopolysaccharide/colanic/teichoic acid biosynthesis glycosyltransferase
VRQEVIDGDRHAGQPPALPRARWRDGPKRVFDVFVAAVALLLAAPILAVAALGIRLSDPGPLVYRARRLGRGGRPFTMYKLRTMRVHNSGLGSPITARGDRRVFPFGALLRRTKIDELPQLINVLRGDMSIIGPRPEDPEIVARYYTPGHRETLTVRPGLASPGSLLHDSCGDTYLGGPDPVAAYVDHLLPVKLGLDRAYVRNVTFTYDLVLLFRMIGAVMRQITRRAAPGYPAELAAARPLIEPARPDPRPLDVRRSSPSSRPTTSAGDHQLGRGRVRRGHG